MHLLEIQGLSKSYNGRQVVKGVDLMVKHPHAGFGSGEVIENLGRAVAGGVVDAYQFCNQGLCKDDRDHLADCVRLVVHGHDNREAGVY